MDWIGVVGALTGAGSLAILIAEELRYRRQVPHVWWDVRIVGHASDGSHIVRITNLGRSSAVIQWLKLIGAETVETQKQPALAFPPSTPVEFSVRSDDIDRAWMRFHFLNAANAREVVCWHPLLQSGSLMQVHIRQRNERPPMWRRLLRRTPQRVEVSPTGVLAVRLLARRSTRRREALRFHMNADGEPGEFLA